MSTEQVPGAEVENNDDLHIGCWAEHKDGSMILVEGVTDDGIVVFSMFDFSDKKDPIEYRSSMPINGFNKSFSYNDGDDRSKKIIWTWHDKTAFPWDRVMSQLRDGVKDISVNKTLSAAQRIIDSLKTKVEGGPLTKTRAQELQKYMKPSLASKVMQRIQKAIGGLGVAKMEAGDADNELVIRVIDETTSKSRAKRIKAQSTSSKSKRSQKGARDA